MFRTYSLKPKINHNLVKLLIYNQKAWMSSPSVNKSKNQSAESSAQYCLETVRKYDYENFLSTLLLNGNQRRECFAIRAFNVEIARISSLVSDDKIGLLRLKFWQQAIDDMYEKKLSNGVPEHPVLLELNSVVQNKKLTKRYLQRLIASRSRKSNESFLSMSELEDYCENNHAASHLGKAQGIVNLLRSIMYLDRSKAIPIPQEILIKHGTSHERVLRNKVDDKGVRECVFDVATTAYQHLEKSRNLSKSVPKECKILFLPAVSIDRYLERLRKSNFHLTSKKLQNRDTMLPFAYYINKIKTSY